MDNLKSITGWHYFKSAPDALYDYLSAQAYDLLEQRNDEVRKISSLKDWKQQQERVRKTLMSMVIDGARETFAEVSRVYRAFGKEKHFKMVEDIGPHGSTPKTNEAIYSFFQEYLNNPGSSSDEVVEILTGEELRVTKTGQVSTSFQEETVFSINSREGDQLGDQLKTSWAKQLPKVKKELLRDLEAWKKSVKAGLPQFK